MGVAKRKQRRRKPPTAKLAPPPVWSVGGVDQWGECFSSDFGTKEAADKFLAKVERKGGCARILYLVWNSGAAGYRLPK
jgi:hypothetical protein